MKSVGIRKLALSAVLVTVMLMLGYVESLIPTGLPGVRLGLSNSVLILALDWLGTFWAFGLMIAKVLLSGFLFSGVAAMLYAFAGGFLSLLAMSLLRRLHFRTITISMAGAVMHNAGQVAAAMLMLRTPGLVYYMGVLMLVGLVTGFLTGSVAQALEKRIPASLLP